MLMERETCDSPGYVELRDDDQTLALLAPDECVLLARALLGRAALLSKGAPMVEAELTSLLLVLLDRTAIGDPHNVHPTEALPSAGVAAATRYPLVKVRADGDEGRNRGWASLTGAELRVVSCVAGGMLNRGIAEELCLSRHTVDAHLKHVYLKLEIHSRVELTVLAMQQRVRAS